MRERVHDYPDETITTSEEFRRCTEDVLLEQFADNLGMYKNAQELQEESQKIITLSEEYFGNATFASCHNAQLIYDLIDMSDIYTSAIGNIGLDLQNEVQCEIRYKMIKIIRFLTDPKCFGSYNITEEDADWVIYTLSEIMYLWYPEIAVAFKYQVFYVAPYKIINKDGSTRNSPSEYSVFWFGPAWYNIKKRSGIKFSYMNTVFICLMQKMSYFDVTDTLRKNIDKRHVIEMNNKYVKMAQVYEETALR